MFGYSQEELLGQPIEILLPERFRKIHPQHHEGYFAAPHIRPMGTGLDLVGRRKDGSEFPVDVTLGPLKTEEGLLVISVIRDITERKHAEETLRESEEKYRTIIQTIEDGYYEVDIAGNFTFHNDSLCRILGYSPSELMGMNNQQYADAETSKQVYQAFNKVFRTGQPRQEFNWPIIRKDGTKRYIDTSIHLMRNATGKPVGFRGILRDITERKRAEKIQSTLFQISEATNLSSNLGGLLQTIHNVLGTLLDTTNFYIALYDQNSDRYSFPYFVDQHDQSDFTPQQLKKSLTDYVRRTGRPLLADQKVCRQLEEKSGVELVGTPSPIWLGVPLKTPNGVIGVVVVQSYTDATAYSEKDLELMTFVSGHIAMAIERKQAEQSLRKSEERSRTIFEQSNDAIFVVDPERDQILDVNAKACTMLSYSREELLSLPMSAIHPNQMSKFRTFAQRVFEQGHGQTDELTCLAKTGQCIPAEISASVVDEFADRPVILALVRDITERKRAGEALRASEASPAGAQRMSHVGSWDWDVEKNQAFCSDEYYRILGVPLGQSDWSFDKFLNCVHPEDRQRVKKAHGDALAGGKPYNTEYRIIRPDGSERIVSAQGEVSVDEAGQPTRMVGTVHDITERKQAEEALRQSTQRNAALIDAIPDMMFTLDRRGVYVDFVPANGLEPYAPPDQFLGRTVFEVLPPSLAQDVMRGVELALDSGRPERLEYELELDDGRHQYEARIVKSKEDEALAIVRDVTAQKRQEREEELRRVRDELEGRVEKEMLGKNPYGLTFREFTVLHLAANGAADKEIADQLGISTFTVSKHVANILGKMAASSRTEACVRALREGLLT
ncbi:MAG: PAS domain S-box protein [Acidobacteria bacterium]|nr:PAS domain S-box protein [Acidobacteriota bacterium]